MKNLLVEIILNGVNKEGRQPGQASVCALGICDGKFDICVGNEVYLREFPKETRKCGKLMCSVMAHVCSKKDSGTYTKESISEICKEQIVKLEIDGTFEVSEIMD